jgi:hypothetical protein
VAKGVNILSGCLQWAFQRYEDEVYQFHQLVIVWDCGWGNLWVETSQAHLRLYNFRLLVEYGRLHSNNVRALVAKAYDWGPGEVTTLHFHHPNKQVLRGGLFSIERGLVLNLNRAISW